MWLDSNRSLWRCISRWVTLRAQARSWDCCVYSRAYERCSCCFKWQNYQSKANKLCRIGWSRSHVGHGIWAIDKSNASELSTRPVDRHVQRDFSTFNWDSSKDNSTIASWNRRREPRSDLFDCRVESWSAWKRRREAVQADNDNPRVVRKRQHSYLRRKASASRWAI